jgi:hypothetical protein
MSTVKFISSPNEIPVGQKYVLVIYGEEHAQTEHPLGLTITVARTVSQLSFLTAVHTAKKIALMSVVNGWGNKLLSPRGRPIKFASRPRVHRAGDEASDDGWSFSYPRVGYAHRPLFVWGLPNV